MLENLNRRFVRMQFGGKARLRTYRKIARLLTKSGAKVTLAAGDTFRAAAIEQLGVWAKRAGAEFVATRQGGDAAGLAFEALETARANGSDVLIIDTAGRLQNKAGLMAELEKIARVIKKLDPKKCWITQGRARPNCAAAFAQRRHRSSLMPRPWLQPSGLQIQHPSSK